MRDLKYYEQRVNNRFGTSAAPEIDASLLPETASAHRLKWRRVPCGDVTVFADGSGIARKVESALRQDGSMLLPIHPFEEKRWPGETFVESGSVEVSASYRTMFFEPDTGGLLADVVGPGTRLMLKLHLENPLPGIPGDRRLSRQIVQKCVTLSTQLAKIMNADRLGDGCEVVPEFLGAATADTGVIFRLMPGAGVLPLFSLFSPDPELAEANSHIEAALRQLYGDESAVAARRFGDELAGPLVRPLFAGFRAGFSIEMHAQNVLFQPGDDRLIDRVFLRDLEGVVFSNRYRTGRGLEPLFEGNENDALDSGYKSMSRWFNRNFDHDLGRAFTASLDALVHSGYFSESDRRTAVRSIRKVVRRLVKDAELGHLHWPGRILPISRSPYGNGLGKGHYYRSRYR